ncbi:hypothetical protein EMMF5_006537 [Cystobasidiomycetes sp. EMM_F5]
MAVEAASSTPSSGSVFKPQAWERQPQDEPPVNLQPGRPLQEGSAGSREDAVGVLEELAMGFREDAPATDPVSNYSNAESSLGMRATINRSTHGPCRLLLGGRSCMDAARAKLPSHEQTIALVDFFFSGVNWHLRNSYQDWSDARSAEIRSRANWKGLATCVERPNTPRDRPSSVV